MKERGVPPPTSSPPFALELTNFNSGKGEQNFNERSFQKPLLVRYKKSEERS